MDYGEENKHRVPLLFFGVSGGWLYIGVEILLSLLLLILRQFKEVYTFFCRWLYMHIL